SGISIDSGNGSNAVVLSGTIAQINNLLTDGGTGTITYLNDSDAPSASTTITVTVNDQGNTGTDPGTSGDGSSEEGSANQTINITAVNDAPVITSTPAENVTGGQSYAYTITATDPDGDPLTINSSGLPDWLELSDNGDGTATLTGTTNNTDAGEHTIALEVTDGQTTTRQTFTLTVDSRPGNPSDDENPQDPVDPEAPPAQDPAEPSPDENLPVNETPVTDDTQASGDAGDSAAEEYAESSEFSNGPEIIEYANTLGDKNDSTYFMHFGKDLYALKHAMPANLTSYEDIRDMSDPDIFDKAIESDDSIAQNDFDAFRAQIDEAFNDQKHSKGLKKTLITVTSATFSIGLVSYIFRAGTLFMSMMSSLPVWYNFDPIFVFSGNKKKSKNKKKESGSDHAAG
ncbi:MAG: hypothetical protein GY874_21325, partial [Desulfobacteraceae bacterium]|nr:hypothetical protein [Desulfobacteraceae bacterium]